MNTVKIVAPNTTVQIEVISECDYLVASREYRARVFLPHTYFLDAFTRDYTKYVTEDPDCDEFDKSAAAAVAECVKHGNYTLDEDSDALHVYVLIA